MGFSSGFSNPTPTALTYLAETNLYVNSGSGDDSGAGTISDPLQSLEQALKNVYGKYKYIVIDSPPSLGLLTINVLTASHSIIIPIQCEYYALEGLSQLLNTVHLIQNNLNSKLEIEGILITMYDSRLNLSNQVVNEVKEYFGDKVFESYIKRNVKLGEAPSFGKPIILYDASSTGAQNYMNLVSEILVNNE